MADYFDQQPNFVNPAYASDKQRETARAYAEQLLKSQTPTTRPSGAIADMLNMLTSGLERRNANNQEAQMYAQALRDNTMRAQSLPGGGGGLPPNIPSAPPQASLMPPPSNPAVGGAVPASMPPTQAKVDNAIATRTNFDGSPRVLSLEGNVPVQPGAPTQVASLGPAAGSPPAPTGAPSPVAPPVAAGPAAPNFDQRFAQSFPNRNQDLAAGLARMQLNPMVPGNIRDSIEGGLNGRPVEDVYGRPGVQSPYTGVRSAPVSGAFTPGVRTPTSISPEGISGTTFTTPPGTPSGQPQSNTPAMGGTGLGGAMDTMNTLRLNSTKSNAVSDIAKADIQVANDAPTVKRVAGIMLDDLRTHGDKMTFGPTAEWSNQVKKVAANYAPGLMKDSLESIASADSFDKMSAQLIGLLSKGGGTDASLFNNMRSVPGSHNSKEGAEALLKMTIQTADQQQALRQAVSAARTPEEYQTLKDDFYKKNPIVNPLTGNPIKLDLEKQTSAGSGSAPAGFRVLKVH